MHWKSLARSKARERFAVVLIETGVQVQGKHRGLYMINAKAVVLASGGFSANAERVASYRPEFKGMASSNQPGATGDGLDLGAATA
jgi:fumarate reductase flavoprotein subunit